MRNQSSNSYALAQVIFPYRQQVHVNLGNILETTSSYLTEQDDMMFFFYSLLHFLTILEIDVFKVGRFSLSPTLTSGWDHGSDH